MSFSSTFILIICFSGFSTWVSHIHCVGIKYTIGGPIGRNVVLSNSPSSFLPYNRSPPYLCFPFVDRWYTYSGSCIRCGSCFFTIGVGVFSIKAFNVAIEVCSWRAPKSRGETHLRVSQSQVAKSWDLEARSQLPTLERGRGSSWEPRD
jgi:hypothetical protein